MKNDEILLQRLAELPMVKQAFYRDLTPAQMEAVGRPGRAVVCVTGGDDPVYVAQGKIARGEAYFPEDVIQNIEMHDEIIESMKVTIRMFNQKLKSI